VRRTFYFLATNAAVMAVASIFILLLPAGIRANHSMFMVIAAVTGIGGALFSLMRSKKSAKRSARVYIIESPRNETENWLLTTVHRQAQQAGIGLPEVGIFESPQMNAFATGAKRDDALVAVSSGLLQNMTREEVEAVTGHEVAHIANGDMITMALIQGVLNTFVLIFARVFASILDRGARDRDGRSSSYPRRHGGLGYSIGFMLGQTVLGFLASIVVAFFSRQREFRADEGGADYASTQKMIAALEKLKQGHSAPLPKQLSAFGINNTMKSLFSTHPPLDVRIAALQKR